MTSSLILKLLILLAFALTINTKPQKLVAKLIHRDSIFSPYYNANESIKDRADRTLKNSYARFKYLQAKVKQNLVIQNDYDNTYVANLSNFVHRVFSVNFSIGLPPVPQLAVMDTGSTVTWIQCKRCQLCARQEIPFYDDRTSSTYKNISCQDPSCVKECDDSGHCIYQIAYMDGTMSRGRLGREQFAFETRDEGIVAVDDVVFGCGLSNSMTIPGLGSGIFGLGYSSISIVHRLGRKFSYCIGDIDDPSYSYNQLKLGEDVDIEGDSTPFELRYGLYFITLEWISIGQERLDIDPDVFEKIQDRGGVVIDSGTELTVLPQAAYDKIANKVHNLLDRFLKPYWADVGTYKRLCYYGNMNRDLKGFPATTFQFSDGAELELEFRALFHIVAEGEFCLWLAPFNISDVEGFSIIGIFAQQNYNVAYDIDKRRIYFQRIECQLLED